MKRLLAIAVGLGISLPASAAEKDISPVVLPAPVVPIAFGHAAHLKLGLKCTMCHPGGLSSRNSRDNLYPKEAVCLTCHNVKAKNPAKVFPKATCDTCHPGFQGPARRPGPPRVRMTRPAITFPHRTLTNIGILCTDCHKGLEKATQPSWDHVPGMVTCLTCHDGYAAPNQCNTCHPLDPTGRMITKFPTGSLQPSGRFKDDDHGDPFYKFSHRASALTNGSYCGNCHAETDCLECHAGAEKPRFHANNYALLHAQDAYTDDGQCMNCHVASRDCMDCHAETNLTLPTRSGEGAVHPEGWASLTPGPKHHGTYARRSVAGCVGCHTEDDCISCHSSQTLRINPHPAGWNANQWRARSEAACKKCHDPVP